MRAHFNRPVQDRAGNQVDVFEVRLLAPGTTDPITDTIFLDDNSGLTRNNPWQVTDGEIDFYLDTPRRVRIGITESGQPEQFLEDIDVLGYGTDSVHPGAGASSTQVGAFSAATGAQSVALGHGAQAAGDQSTALGHGAQAELDGAVAVGALADAPHPGAVAVGNSSTADGSQAVAVGVSAQASHNGSVALGPGAATTAEKQVMLGTPDGEVVVPGGFVLISPDGTRFLVQVTDDGRLTSQQYPVPPVEEPLPEAPPEV